MKKIEKNTKKSYSRTQKICFCALVTAVICACTFIALPLPIGYFNLGDVAVLVSAYVGGPLWGTLAAALGSSLADLLMGYTLYAPATALIKAVVALAACLLYRIFKKIILKESLDLIPRAIASVVAEIFMVVGYFLYEAFILTYGLGASVSIPGNAVQALCGVLGSTIFMTAIRKLKLHI